MVMVMVVVMACTATATAEQRIDFAATVNAAVFRFNQTELFAEVYRCDFVVDVIEWRVNYRVVCRHRIAVVVVEGRFTETVDAFSYQFQWQFVNQSGRYRVLI